MIRISAKKCNLKTTGLDTNETIQCDTSVQIMGNVVSSQTKEPSIEDNLEEDICLFDDSDDNSDMEVSKESSESLEKTGR